jgi:Leucine-rich repeat (LRR) protein
VRFLLLFAAVAVAMADDRTVAEWVIRQGGRILVAGQPPIAELRGLSEGPVTLTGVDLYGTIIEPKDLAQLSGLSQLKELYLPGPSWNPGAGSRLDANEELKFLAPLRSLEKLHFSLHFLTNVNVQDKGLKHLESLTNLRELRLAQGRVKNFSFAGFAQLESLDLSYSTATDEVLKSLAGLKKLKRLHLRDTLVTDAGLAHLAGVTSLEEIDLYGLKISDRGLAHLKGLQELRKLNVLGGPVSDEGAEILAGLPKLRELNLYRAELTNAGVAKLAALRELAFLDLRYTRATASGVEKLRAALPHSKIDFTGSVAAASARSAVTDADLEKMDKDVEVLDLDTTEVSDIGVAFLAKFTRLKKLRLGSTTVSDRGLAALAKLPQLESLSLSGTLVRTLGPLSATLRDLDLSSTGITADALPHITALPALTRLNLAYTDLTDANLAKIGGIAALKTIDLTGTDVGDATLAGLAKLPQIEELLINHGRFKKTGVPLLAPLVNLRRLEAVRTSIDATAAATLARFTKLEQLNLDYTSFNDEGLKSIAALPLKELRLDSANITDASVDVLSNMKSLRLLNLYHTLVSEEGHARLVKALPQTKIIWDRDSKLPNRRGS